MQYWRAKSTVRNRRSSLVSRLLLVRLNDVFLSTLQRSKQPYHSECFQRIGHCYGITSKIMLATVRTAAFKSATRNVARSFGSDEKLVKTAFYDQHAKLGGKFVPFAGYELPVQYEGLGVLKEHLHTRAPGCASVFDVSHMGQIKWTGKDAVKFIEKMVVGDIAALKEGEAKLSLIMNEAGGIVDDTVIANAGDFIYMVVNGACKYKDMEHFKKYMKGMDVHMDYLGDQQLLALQVRTDMYILSLPSHTFQSCALHSCM